MTVTVPIEIDVMDLPALGWVIIEEVGEENVYLTQTDGTEYFYRYN